MEQTFNLLEKLGRLNKIKCNMYTVLFLYIKKDQLYGGHIILTIIRSIDMLNKRMSHCLNKDFT